MSDLQEEGNRCPMAKGTTKAESNGGQLCDISIYGVAA